MWIIVLIIWILFTIYCYFSKKANFTHSIICLVGILLITTITFYIDKNIQTTDYEVWSGSIEDVKHIEEYDEWHPPKTETYKDSDGKTRTRTIAGYWEHHYAKNYIKTSDNGDSYVSSDLKNTITFNDRFPNTKEELLSYYPIGMPTSSVHSYENVLKTSSSLYKYDGNINDFDLPNYPMSVTNFQLTRLIGRFNDSDKINHLHQKWNSILNDKFQKQVNWIMVKFDDNNIDKSYALQEHWKNGNKNDYIVVLTTDGNNDKILYTHIISWTEAEILNTKVKDYFYNKEIADWETAINDIGEMIKNDFVRKEMADYKEYIIVETSNTAVIINSIICILITLGFVFVIEFDIIQNNHYRRYRRY